MQQYLINSHEVVKINHQQYSISIRTNCIGGKVILCLHGGPGLPDAQLVKHYNSDLATDATLVMWDQRGAGESYSASFAFKKNLMKERMLDDINNLVDYLCRRFCQQRIILLSHDFGTVLSVWYVQRHPEKIECLIQANQVVNNNGNEASYNFKSLLPVVPTLLAQRGLHGMIKFAIGAKWSLNTPLAKEQFDLREAVQSLSVPLYLLMGTKNSAAKAWFDSLAAPDKEYYYIENCEGNPMFLAAEQFNNKVKEIMGRR